MQKNGDKNLEQEIDSTLAIMVVVTNEVCICNVISSSLKARNKCKHVYHVRQTVVMDVIFPAVLCT